MTDSDVPDAGCPGKWPRPLRLALDAIVTVLMNAYMMARSLPRAASTPARDRCSRLWSVEIAHEFRGHLAEAYYNGLAKATDQTNEDLRDIEADARPAGVVQDEVPCAPVSLVRNKT